MMLRTSSIALLAAAALAGPAAVSAGEDWALRDGRTAPGDLESFDFGDKRVVFRDRRGEDHPVPVEDLTAASRWRLLVSPAFARSFPEDDWTDEQRRYYLLMAAGPGLSLFVSFYLCALLLMKKATVWQALAGWFGSILLGGFLMGFYLVLSEKAPTSATGILIAGGLVILVVLSIFISVVYRSTALEGAKLLIVHFFGALFFLLLLLLAARKATQVFDCEPFIKEKIMIPVGLLPKE